MPDDQVYKTPQPDSGGDRESGCNCWYEVLDAWHEVPPVNQPYVEVNFWSWTSCLDDECTYFTSYYSSHPSQHFINTFSVPEYCNSIWDNFPPSNSIQFNCNVPSYSSFDINLQALSFDGFPPSVGDDLPVCIKFRIGCYEDCGGVVNAVYSDNQILCFEATSFPLTHETSSNRSANASVLNMGLGGCGCSPYAVD